MAAPIIYTGQNYARAPQTQGRALQALGQFTQQHQMRKEAELERSRKDRDTFAKLMEMDPVYATSSKLQMKIGEVWDNYTDVMTKINRDLEGRPMNSQDLMKMQQEKGRAMGQMGQLKALDTELNRAAQMTSSDPRNWDTRLFNEAFADLQKDGVRPPGGFLFKKVQNPSQMYEAYAANRIAKTGGYRDIRGDWTAHAGGGGEYTYTRQYPGQADNPDEKMKYDFAVASQYDIQHSFDWEMEKNPKEKEKYMKAAGGNEDAAANLWFAQTTPSAYKDFSYTTEQRPSISETSPARQGIRILDGSIYDGDTRISSVQSNVPVVGGKLDKAIVFDQAEAKSHTSSIPKDTFILPEGVEMSSPSVNGVVYAADKNKTYWIVDRRSLDKVSFTESAMEAFGKDAFTKDPETGKYKIKEGFESDVMLPTRTDDVMSLVDNWTRDLFRKQLNELPEDKKEIIIEWD